MKRKTTTIRQQKTKKINKIESTDEKLSSRGGLYFLIEFVENSGILQRLDYKFRHIKDSNKGLTVRSFFKQVISVLLDGSKRDLTYFDELKKDSSYHDILNMSSEELASSHQIKRMIAKFLNEKRHIRVFRDILTDMFISNLILDKPEVIEIGIDTMVLNNDDSSQKEGCTPTYKGVKGYQPLQVYWNGMVIDAIFREGKCHSNHSNDVMESIKYIVKKIRKNYQKDVPIILKMDSGFLSNENFTYFEEVLKIHYVCVGKMYQSIKNYIGELRSNNRKIFQGNHEWEYIEFGNKLQSWTKFRRAIYAQQVTDNAEQMVLDFARSDRVIYTNIGCNLDLDKNLIRINQPDYFTAEFIIKQHHKRATDELINRDLKEFMLKEKLPFKSFSSNQVFYYLMVISFIFMRIFQNRIIPDLLPENLKPNTFRRLFIDIPGKIVYHARQKVLKLQEYYYEKYKLKELKRRIINLKGFIAYS